MNQNDCFFSNRGGKILILALLLVALFAIMPAVADGGLADSAWPKFGHDAQNTGQSQYTGSPANITKWIFTAGDTFYYSNPVIGSDGTIYIGNRDMTVYALDPNGTVTWSRGLWGSSTDQIYGSAAVGSDGTIYIGSGTSFIYAINSNGTKKWNSASLGSLVGGSPAIDPDGNIYVGVNYLNVLNRESGSIKWRNTSGGANYLCPAIGTDGTIYIGSQSKSKSYAIYAYRPDGTLKWKNTTGGAIFGSPAIGTDGTIYIGNKGDYKFYAWNPDGTLKWSNPTGGAIMGSPAIGSDGTIYIGSADYYVYAWNPDGTLKWKYLTGGAIEGSPAIGADGTIYIGSDDRNIYALNPDGTLKWFYTTGDKVMGTPSIGPDGSVYVPSYDKKLYAFAGVVDYTADQTLGVTTPFAVQFTGTSPLAVTAWHWDFGDGTTSDEQNPKHTYTAAGAYAVNLTITHSNGNNYLIRSDYIKVYGAPVANFTSDITSGKSPLTVQFTDTSTGSPTSWHWDFDNDGTIDSTEQNPSHQYSTTGTDTVTYTVNLTATNAADSNTTSKIGYITLYSNPPTVSFTATPRIGTTAPLTVQFRDTSTLNPTSWLWDFGDGDTTNATVQNPVHTYATAGTYPVSLTATNVIGSGSASKPGFITFVTPGPIDPSYPYLYVANDEGVKYDINGTNPVYVPNTYSFATMGGVNALHISSGTSVSDVTTTTNQSGTFYFTHTGGQPTVPEGILMLAVNGTIPDDFSVHIRSSGDNWTPSGPSYVNGDAPTEWNYAEGAVDQTFTKDDFIYGPQSWKPSSYPIYYGEDQADPINQFRIMFIDLNAGKAYHDIKVEYAFTNLTSFAAFNAYGWYLASNHGTMIMTNDVTGGSTYGPSGYLIIGIPDVPKADFTASTSYGWHNLAPIQFTDTSANVPQSWHWDFGDGTSSSERNVVHTYAMAGTYTVNLTVTNVKGTNSMTQVLALPVPPVPVAGFTENVTSGTSPFAVQFNDTSTNLPVAWYWDFGDGTYSTEQNPVHWYAPGTYPVSLTVTNGGGSNTIQKTGLISAASNGRTNQFANPGFETGDTTGWTTGTYASLSSGTVHTGDYSVCFSDTSSAEKGSRNATSVEQYVDLTGVANISFWGYGEYTDVDQSFYILIDGMDAKTYGIIQSSWNQYTIPTSGYTGVHQVKVAFGRNYRGARSYVDDFVAERGVSITAPVAAFTASQTSGTVPLTVQFTDISTNTPTSWSWDFGDGTTATTQNPVHTYTTAGTYTVNLTATNAVGNSSVQKTITAFNSGAAGVVPGYSGVYVRVSNDDGLKYDYANNGMYYINENGGGLNAVHISTDPGVSAGQVTVSPAQSGTFYVTDTGGRGYQDNVILMLAVNGTIPDDFTAHIKTSGYTWTPGTVMNKAPATGEYTYQPTALDETFTKDDFIYGPQNWKPSGSNIIYPLFSGEDMSSPANQYQLAFIDTRAGLLGTKHADYAGLTDKGTVKVEYSFSNLPSYAAFNLYAWNSNTTQGQGMGWTNRLDGDGSSGYSVYVLPSLTAAFTAETTTGADPLTVRFTDASTGSPVAWAWDFENDGTPDSTEQNPAFTYPAAGTYTVKLTVTDAAGATDDETQTITVSETGPIAAPEFPTVAFPVLVISMFAFLAMAYRKVDSESP